MKPMTKNKIATICLFTIVSASYIFANPISEESAKAKAEHILSCHMAAEGRRLMRADGQHKIVCVKRGFPEEITPSFYIFSRQDRDGFVIIAGDDDMPELIGYSLHNNVDPDNMPDALKELLTKYRNSVRGEKGIIENHNSRDISKVVTSNEEPLEPGTPIVGPYIKTKWNQGEPYNWLTPDRNGKRTPTGCVPTAAAQILYYYKYPNIYHIYNWDSMLETYLGNYSHAEGIAVATLMRDLGALMDTDYRPAGSRTGGNYFRIPGLIYNSYDSDSLKTELIDRGPLIVSGWPPSTTNISESHAFIIDGYDSNGYYHVNWGWGGSYDGYYKELALHSPGWGTSVYYFKPDLENPAAIPVACGGVSINTRASKTGHKVIITLHQVCLATGKLFDGSISCGIYKISESQFYNYTGEGFYGDGNSYKYGYSDFSVPSIKWNSEQQETDVNVEIDLGKISGNGYYVFVPKYYNRLERNPMWRPFIQFGDGSLNEDIPFIYKDENFIFKEALHGDFNIDVSQICTASTYREKGRSSLYAFVKNEGNNIFTGIITAKFVNTNDTNDIKTIDMALYVPANYSNRTTLNTSFDFIGSYCLKEIEVWKKLPTGERRTYLNKKIDGTEFSILPYDSHSVTTDYYANANIQILWKNDTAYVNDSIYRYEEANMQFYAYSLDADTAAIDVELWALPVKGGVATLLKKGTYPLSKNGARINTIGGSTANMTLGDYRLVLFGRCGNNTAIFSQPDTIGKGSQNLTDFITDNIIHVFDPGIDIPMLKLNKLNQVDNLYYGISGFVEAEIENNSGVALQSCTSNSIVAGSNMIAYVSPFRIMPGEVATIYPRLYLYKDYTGTSGVVEDYLRYKINNGIRDLIIPIDGNYKVQFIEKPELLKTNTSIAFYYKNNLSQKPSLGFYSKGVLKRSLWKDGDLIATFSDLQTDSTYNTYKVCPEGSEIKELSVGNYLLKVNLTDIYGNEWSTISYPVIIDEEELPIKIEKVEFDTNRSFSYDGEIPIIITVNNPTLQTVSTLLSTIIYKKAENGGWYVDEEELHPVILPADQSTTVSLNAHVISQSNTFRQEGTFEVYVKACRTKRNSGHLDFGSSKRSEPIILPYVSSGVNSIDYNTERIPIAYYTLDGKHVSRPSRGLYIIKYSDGTAGKKFEK